MMTWLECAYTFDPPKAVLKLAVSVLAVLAVTLTLQLYVIQPGTDVHPATVVLVLFFASWIGVLGLTAAVMTSITLIVLGFRASALARPSRAVVEVQRKMPAQTWVRPMHEDSTAWIRAGGTEDLLAQLGREQASSMIPDAITVASNSHGELSTVEEEEKEVHDCVAA